jgi:DNA-binding XRE family transcriptional regulator
VVLGVAGKSTQLSLIVCRSIVYRQLGGSVEIRQRLATNLRRYRAEKGWSQEQFAFEAGIHRTYVSDLERASRNPSLTVLERLAKPLEITASALIAEPGEDAR